MNLETVLRTLKQRCDGAESRAKMLEQALGQAQRQIAGSKDAESMRLMEEKNEHLTFQLEALREALRGAHQQENTSSNDSECRRLRERATSLTEELKEARSAAATDVDQMVRRLEVGEERFEECRESLKREKLRADKEQQRADANAALVQRYEAKAHGTVRAFVPKDAVPGTSRIMVSYQSDDNKAKTVAVLVPRSASPGAYVDLSRRLLESEELREVERRFEKTSKLLEDTAADLGKAMDERRSNGDKADNYMALAAANDALKNEWKCQWRRCLAKSAASETANVALRRQLDAALTSELQLRRGELFLKAEALAASTAACGAAISLQQSLQETQDKDKQRAISQVEATYKAAAKKAAALVKDLKHQLKRERDGHASARAQLEDQVKSTTVVEQPQIMDHPLAEAENHPLAVSSSEEESPSMRSSSRAASSDRESRTDDDVENDDDEEKKVICETCALLALRLEGLLAENAKERERISFLETAMQDLNADLAVYRDTERAAIAAIELEPDGTIGI